MGDAQCVESGLFEQVHLTLYRTGKICGSQNAVVFVDTASPQVNGVVIEAHSLYRIELDMPQPESLLDAVQQNLILPQFHSAGVQIGGVRTPQCSISQIEVPDEGGVFPRKQGDR